MRFTYASLIAAGLLVAGCFEPVEVPPACVMGESAACTCTSGATGAQVCNASGAFEPCVCEGEAPADAGADAGEPTDGGNQECPAGHCVINGACGRDTDEQLCAQLGIACGIGTTTDSCGNTRNVTCSICQRNQEIPPFPSNDPTLQCIRGFYEPGNPNSQYAYSFTEKYPTVRFRPGGLDSQAQPLLDVTLDIKTDAYPVPALVRVHGDAGTNSYVPEAFMGATVASGPVAALRTGSDLVVDLEAQANLRPLPSYPPGVAYVKCFGETVIEPAEPDTKFCQSYGWSCSTLSGTDGTGRLRSNVACGTCMSPEQCLPYSYFDQPGRHCAVCSPESDFDFCGRLGKNCGMVTDVDNCGTARTADCGACTSPATCGGGGTPNVCGGVALTCTWGRQITGPPQPGTFCPSNPPGNYVDGTEVITQLTFVYNTSTSRYEAQTNVQSIVSGTVIFFMYSAQDTTVYWTEVTGTGTRNGNTITFNKTSQRSSPMGCSNSFKYVTCSGSTPFVFGP